jgi:hypothetical protein
MAGPAGRRDAVLVCGGRWHDFDRVRLRLLGMLDEHPQVRTRVFEDFACTSALSGADFLVTYTCDVRPDEPQQDALVEFVAKGGRWLALHGTNSAIDPPPAADGSKRFSTPRVLGDVAQVLGSQFLAHPKIEPYAVEVADPDHPFVAGVEPFTVNDELYVSELHGPLHVLLHTRFAGECPGFVEGLDDDEPRPVLYLRRHGAGEVAYFTLGHCRGRYDVQDLGVDDLGRIEDGSWSVPEFRTVLDRCLAWAVHGHAGVPSPTTK